VATALRTGLFPLHGGIAALCDRWPRLQLQQLITVPVLVFAHIRFVDDTKLAFDSAIPLVVLGAVSMLAFALVSLAQRTLPGLYRASTFMHGGMLFAAVGAAARGHYAAALIVSMTMTLSLTGFSLMLSSFEQRVGPLAALGRGGRARAFPRLAAALLFFGGAAVGLPGTSGFIADDLLLHALWGESVASAVMMILASAMLAVATFATFSRALLGTPLRQLAPDLQTNERGAAGLLIALLVLLGTVPAFVVSPVNVLMSRVP
jgi:NADH-quinone oxidoreductase subunit M